MVGIVGITGMTTTGVGGVTGVEIIAGCVIESIFADSVIIAAREGEPVVSFLLLHINTPLRFPSFLT